MVAVLRKDIRWFDAPAKIAWYQSGQQGGRVRVRIIHGLNISHKELTYLLRKICQPSNQKYYNACSQGASWQELTIARPRPSRKDKQSKYNAHQFGYIVRRPYVHATRITNLNTNILTKPQSFTSASHILASTFQNVYLDNGCICTQEPLRISAW